MTVTASRNERTLANLRCGERFMVRSRSGRLHRLLFLARGQAEAGLFVRMASNHLARLEPARILWETCQLTLEAAPILVRGDEVLVETADEPGRASRAAVIAVDARTLALDLDGRQRVLGWDELRQLDLVFNAPNLRAGDSFMVQSKSGTRYRGHARRVDEAGVAATLEDGRQVQMRADRLDLATLRVLIPLDPTLLRSQLQHHGAQTLDQG